MNTSAEISTENPRIETVRFEGDELVIELSNEQEVRTPTHLHPRLHFAPSEEREEYEIWNDGRMIHWPTIDEDISLEGLIKRKRSQESPQSLIRALFDQFSRRVQEAAQRLSE